MRVYITISFPDGCPLTTKTAVDMPERFTITQAAKRLRLREAEELGCRPSALTWAVYANFGDTVPILQHPNFRHAKWE